MLLAALTTPCGSLAEDLLPVAPHDFRISFLGPHGNDDFAAYGAAAAYNALRGEVLVVWNGDDDSGGLVQGEHEVWARRIDAVSGEPLGPQLRLSAAGGLGDPLYYAGSADVAWDPTHDEYLVVWTARDTGLAPFEQEIYGVRLDGADASALGPVTRYSSMGGIGDPFWSALAPAVAYATSEDEFLVVWSGTDPALGQAEQEIWGLRIEGGTGSTIGAVTRLSDLGGSGDSDYRSDDPDVAYCASANEYWVAFAGSDDSEGQVPGELEVFVQRIDAATGSEVGVNDLRVSRQAGLGDQAFDAADARIACLAGSGAALVVWRGDGAGGQADNEWEIFGQLLDTANGLEIGDDVRLSDAGGIGDAAFVVGELSVTAMESGQRFLVTWRGEDSEAGLHPDKREIRAQLVDAGGAEAGSNDLRVTTVGSPLDPSQWASQPEVVTVGSRFLVVFSERENHRLGKEIEIAGQFVDLVLFADGFESGGASAWSPP